MCAAGVRLPGTAVGMLVSLRRQDAFVCVSVFAALLPATIRHDMVLRRGFSEGYLSMMSVKRNTEKPRNVTPYGHME